MRLIVVDDHPMVRNALAQILALLTRPTDLGFDADLDTFAKRLEAGETVDCVLLDLGLPGFQGIEALEEVRLRFPTLPVVVLSGQDDRSTVIRCLEAGAMGFIPKSFDDAQLRAALQQVLDGYIYVPPQALGLPARPTVPAPPPPALREPPPALAAGGGPATPTINAGSSGTPCPAGAAEAVRPPAGGLPWNPDTPLPNIAPDPVFDALTERQMDVLKLLIKGLSNKLIARELGLSDNTVKVHLGHVFRQLGTSNRLQTILAARARGLRL